MMHQEAIEWFRSKYAKAICEDGKTPVGMAISALEKQIPKKLIPEGDGYADGSMIYDSFYCPSCDHRMEEDEVKDYCPECGQKICWEGEQ